MTDEQQACARAVDGLLERNLITEGERFLANIVASATLAALRDSGCLAQEALPVVLTARGGASLWL